MPLALDLPQIQVSPLAMFMPAEERITLRAQTNLDEGIFNNLYAANAISEANIREVAEACGEKLDEAILTFARKHRAEDVRMHIEANHAHGITQRDMVVCLRTVAYTREVPTIPTHWVARSVLIGPAMYMPDDTKEFEVKIEWVNPAVLVNLQPVPLQPIPTPAVEPVPLPNPEPNPPTPVQLPVPEELPAAAVADTQPQMTTLQVAPDQGFIPAGNPVYINTTTGLVHNYSNIIIDTAATNYVTAGPVVWNTPGTYATGAGGAGYITYNNLPNVMTYDNATITINGNYFTTGTTQVIYQTDGTGNWYGYNNLGPISVGGTVTSTYIDPKEVIRYHLKEKIRRNLRLDSDRKRNGLTTQVDPAEIKARETLRDMLSESDWRRYVTNGFIMVKAASGIWYQIHNHKRVQIYEGGKRIGELCIHSQGCPPSDHVINMKIMLELDEDAVWTGANKFLEPSYQGPLRARDPRTVGNNILVGNLDGIVINNAGTLNVDNGGLAAGVIGNATPKTDGNLIELFKSLKAS